MATKRSADSENDQQRNVTKKSRTKSSNLKLPPALERLERLFPEINTFCAFCDARLTTAVTLDRIRSAVPDARLADLAAINVIMPDFIHFEHQNANMIIQFGKPVSKRIAREKQTSAMRNRGDEWAMRKPAPKPLKPEMIKRTIDQRNKKFIKSLKDFFSRCLKEKIDPSEHLAQEVQQNMPSEPSPSPPSSSSATAAAAGGGSQNIPSDEIISTNTNTEPTPLADVLERLRVQPFYRGQLDTEGCERQFPQKHAQYGTLDPPLPQEIQAALEQKGIHELYTHQTIAIQSLREKKHVIVATSTASGKSLIYQLPVLESLLTDDTSKAMYIFPTKALAQDQMRAMKELVQLCPSLSDMQMSTFDGDTPSEDRAGIRANASVIFTNPDMLHHAILPNCKSWRYFLGALRYVVVDELHIYNGLFGTNVALIMRRLRRLCHHFGNNNVQFVSCSATIKDPAKHMRLVFGVDNVQVVNQDGAPCGRKKFIVWNPPLLNPMDPQAGRRGAVAEGAEIFEYLMSNNVRTIAFCKIRKTCELLMKQLRENLEKKQNTDMLKRIMSYRGGYMPHDRRKIERQMFNGELLGVVATNALELGVDIGSLDAVLMIGMPWSISALWQQSGRAGRRNTDSLSMVIADGNPLDQFYSRHPAALFDKSVEDIFFEVEKNTLILENHLQCAAEEMPINIETDAIFFGPETEAICKDHLTSIGNNMYRPHPRFQPYPSQFVNIRNIVEETYAVVDVTGGRNTVLEEIESSRAPFEIYEGAVFIHQGKTYLVEECNTDQRYAKVHYTLVDWTTTQRDYTNVNVVNTTKSKPLVQNKSYVAYGKVQIETVVFGYHKLDKRSRIIDTLELYMDPILRYSTGVWADVPSNALAKLDDLDIDRMAAIHAAAHALISLLPRFASSTSIDIRTECKSPYATRPRPPRIALYETQPSGIIRQAYQFFGELVDTCIQQITSCSCEEGCPSCVHLASCSEHNVLCSKMGGLIVLKSLLNLELDPQQ